jgi:hypothetical protein
MIGFPLLLIPLAIVNIAVFLMGLGLDRLQEPVVSVGLPSLQSWTITYSDLLLSLSLLLLLVEVVKSARPGSKYFTDHFLSVLVFAAAAAEFLLLPQFANSAFFLLTLMAFVDVVAGISIRFVRPKIAAVRAPAPEPVVHAPPPPPPAPVAPEVREVRPAPPVVVEETRPVESTSPAREADIKVEPRDTLDTPQAEILPPDPTIPRR